MSRIGQILFAAALCTVVGTAGATAMPVSNLGAVDVGTNVETVRWVCGPYRCWWRPNYYYGGYYAYRPYYRPYGWYRPRWGYGYRPWRRRW